MERCRTKAVASTTGRGVGYECRNQFTRPVSRVNPRHCGGALFSEPTVTIALAIKVHDGIVSAYRQRQEFVAKQHWEL